MLSLLNRLQLQNLGRLNNEKAIGIHHPGIEPNLKSPDKEPTPFNIEDEDVKPELDESDESEASDSDHSASEVLKVLQPKLRDRLSLKAPDRYGYFHDSLPQNITKALKLPVWIPPIEKELETIEELGVWEYAEESEVLNPLNTTWAFQSKIASLQALLSYSVDKSLKILQFDVKGAFLHAPLEEDVFIRMPAGSKRTSSISSSRSLCMD